MTGVPLLLCDEAGKVECKNFVEKNVNYNCLDMKRIDLPEREPQVYVVQPLHGQKGHNMSQEAH